MKIVTKLAFGASMLALPFVALADTSSTTIGVPAHISPTNAAIFSSSSVPGSYDWSDVVIGSSSASYHFELSKSTTTNVSGGFTAPVTVSSLLATSSIPFATGTSDGVYYWHVRVVDSTNLATGTWTTPWSFTLDRVAPTTPTNLNLVSSVLPNASTTNGTQVWSFGTSSDVTSGILGYQYALDSTSTWNDTPSTSFTTSFGTGTHSVAVRALDKAGNISSIVTASLSVTASSTVVTQVTSDTPRTIKQCKNGGWKTFVNPTFKNQGRCVSFVEKAMRDVRKNEDKERHELRKKIEEAKKEARKREEEIRKEQRRERKSWFNEHTSSSTPATSTIMHGDDDSREKHSEKRGHKGERD